MDVDTIENRGVVSLIKLTEEHGGWPMTMNPIDWKYKAKPWQEINWNFMKIFGGNSPLFSVALQADIKNSSYNILWVNKSV